MSWEVVGDERSLGQFASGGGYAELVEACAGCPALEGFFESGETSRVEDVVRALREVEGDADVVATARGLANLMEGQKTALITDGLVEDAEDEEPVEKAGGGVMVAFFPPEETARALALAGGEKPEEIHLTLAYLGREVDEALMHALRAAVAGFAAAQAPLSGTIGGPGRFNATEHSDGKDVCFATFDSTRIQEFRAALVEALERAGLEPRDNFGYTPHLTLKYIEPGAPLPTQRVEPETVVFGAVTLCVGGAREVFPLTGEPDVELSGAVTKVDAERKMVFGWFSIVAIEGRKLEDVQGDVIDSDTLELSAYDYVLRARKGGAMHESGEDDEVVAVARLVESVVFTKEKQAVMQKSLRDQGIDASLDLGCVAWWGGFKVEDPDVWKRVKSGELKAFSIGGKGKREKIEKYSEDQPRDEAGRWTDGGGGEAAAERWTAAHRPLGPKGIEQRKAVVALMMRPGGATEAEIKAATGWARMSSDHLSSMKRAGYVVKMSKNSKGEVVYTITRRDAPKPVEPAAAKPPEEQKSPRAEDEQKLSTGVVVSEKGLGGGINETKIVTLADGTKAVFKPESGIHEGVIRRNITPGNDIEREAAAWEVAKLVGMHDLVPPTVIREVKGERGSVQLFEKGKIAYDVGQKAAYDGLEDHARAAVFDYVIGNMDRHAGNWLVNEATGKMKLIDHGLSFPDKPGYMTYGNQRLMRDLTARIIGATRAPNIKQIAARYKSASGSILQALEKVGLPSGSIQGVRERLDALSRMSSWTQLKYSEPELGGPKRFA